ncbi:ubiquinone biosynthesis protein [Kitasatospora sp. SolWspMP-SS2h]|uniref:ABC1 kinase family protein n=1 Tax=Kitasatospora sp. SolWspMP-SS2h TaxID=1305729 RepID=UPI000DBAD465|nr:AarF/UbiB family protein [Kitasatospora sp. SolWspMP-SS2h]RAJ45440.1 ubiquinone biosynthesis protein [Kitasatospora sp. SolWspMP-SS2h]
MPQRRTRGWLLIGRACATTAIIAGHLIAALPLLATRRGRARMADRTPRLLTALGPFFVKAGQLVSTRRDLLPERWCDALAELADEVRPPRRAAVARTLAGAGLADAFAEFDWEPVACGSIASVHRARLADGTEVAVKVQRHGIRPVLEADLRLALLGARAGRVLPGMRDLPAEEMIGQLGGAVLHQLDFTAERDALLLLRANLGGHTDLRIPAPVEGLCAPGVLTMEFVPGLGRFRPLGMTPERRREVVRDVLRAVYRMLFVDGLVHCDLHPGNLCLDGEGRVVVLDAGFVVRLPDPVRRSFAGFFLNMAQGNGPRCADIVLASAARLPADLDREGFRTAVTALVDEAFGALSKDFELAAFAPRLFKLQRDFGVFAAAEFAFPLLSLLVLEGMIKEFDSEVDFQAEAVPVLMASFAKDVELDAARTPRDRA